MHALQLRGHGAAAAGLLQRLRGFGTGNIVRVPAGQGEGRQLQGIGAVEEVSPEGIGSSVVVTGSRSTEATCSSSSSPSGGMAGHSAMLGP